MVRLGMMDICERCSERDLLVCVLESVELDDLVSSIPIELTWNFEIELQLQPDIYSKEIIAVTVILRST